MMPGPPCFRISARMLSTPGDLPSFNIRTALSSFGESPVSLVPRRLRFSRYLDQFLVCNCTAPCSIPSIVCGLPCLLLRARPSHFQLSSSLFIVTESAISEC